MFPKFETVGLFFEKIAKHKWTLELEGHDELKINLHQFGTGIQKQGI